MKKFLLVLTLIFLQSCLLWAYENLVPNPGFLEAGPDGASPLGWEYKQNFISPVSPGDVSGRWEKSGPEGARSLSIDDKRWFSASQWGAGVKNIKENTFYLFSLRAKRDSDTGWVPALRLFSRTRSINLKRPGEYFYFEFLLNSGKTGGDDELALIVHRKPSKIYFSGLRLVEFLFGGLSPAGGERVKGAGIKFSWELPENSQALSFVLRVYEKSSPEPIVSVENLENNFFHGLKLPDGAYSWDVEALAGAAVIARSPREEFFVYGQNGPSPRAEPGEGALEKNNHESVIESLRSAGRFPVGVSSLPAEYALRAQKAGINWVFHPREIEPFAGAGMKLIRSPGRDGADIFYLRDEPDQHGVLPADMRKEHFAARQADPRVPTAVTVYDPASYLEYAGVADVFMVDPYPVPVRPLSSVAEAVAGAKKAVGNKPVWAIIQAFDWSEASAEARREGIARMPSEEEMLSMALLAVASGAEGVVFYTIIRGGTSPEDVFPGIFSIASKLREKDYFLALPGGESFREGPVYFLDKKDGGRILRLAVNSSGSAFSAGGVELGPLGYSLTEVMKIPHEN